jgi:hypothetical protein
VFDNLFSILGPTFSAAILVSVVLTAAIFPMHRLRSHRLQARKAKLSRITLPVR